MWRRRSTKDGSRKPILGLADVKAVCTKYSGAICMDTGEFGTTWTAAHEIGHKYIYIFYNGSLITVTFRGWRSAESKLCIAIAKLC